MWSSCRFGCRYFQPFLMRNWLAASGLKCVAVRFLEMICWWNDRRKERRKEGDVSNLYSSKKKKYAYRSFFSPLNWAFSTFFECAYATEIPMPDKLSFADFAILKNYNHYSFENLKIKMKKKNSPFVAVKCKS